MQHRLLSRINYIPVCKQQAAPNAYKIQYKTKLDGLQCIWRHTVIFYRLEDRVYYWCTGQVTQLFTYLLTHELFSSCIRQYLV